MFRTLWGRLFLFNPFRSLTLLGTVGFIADFLLHNFDASALTPTGHAVLVVVSSVIGVTGIRNALERAKSPPPSPSSSATS